MPDLSGDAWPTAYPLGYTRKYNYDTYEPFTLNHAPVNIFTYLARIVALGTPALAVGEGSFVGVTSSSVRFGCPQQQLLGIIELVLSW